MLPLITFVVAFLSFHENVLEQKVVEATDWLDALEQAYPGVSESLCTDSMEEAQDSAFDQDWVFSVIEVK